MSGSDVALSAVYVIASAAIAAPLTALIIWAQDGHIDWADYAHTWRVTGFVAIGAWLLAHALVEGAR